MEQLPTHVATSDEPIDDLGTCQWNGPDMNKVLPIEVMLGALHQLRDAPLVRLKLWRAFVKSVGGYVTLSISRSGDEELHIGLPCDAQMRHRSRWTHFLSKDLNETPEQRDLLIAQLIARGAYADNRPADPRATTRAVRDFIRHDGRILIDPKGELSEGGGMPRAFTHGSDDVAAECVRASRAYFAVRRRWRSDRQIKRAVRMLGKRTDNGWIVLESSQRQRQTAKGA